MEWVSKSEAERPFTMIMPKRQRFTNVLSIMKNDTIPEKCIDSLGLVYLIDTCFSCNFINLNESIHIYSINEIAKYRFFFLFEYFIHIVKTGNTQSPIHSCLNATKLNDYCDMDTWNMNYIEQ